MNAFTEKNLIPLFQQAINKRASLARITNALRLVNGRADGLPGIVIEQYHNHFVIQQTRVLPEWTIKIIIRWVTEAFHPEFLILKDRTTSAAALSKGYSGKIITGSDAKTIVTENNLRFRVDCRETLNSGLFLDMRANRMLIARRAENKTVLNCFAYTCSFGVYCRAHGASEVTNVDISKKALDWGKENYALNGLRRGDAEFMRFDCADYLKMMKKKNRRFDIVIIDPPTFSRSKEKVFSVKKDLEKTAGAALELINTGGHLLAASNCRSISTEMLRGFLRRQTHARGLSLKRVIPLGQDIDFPGSGTIKESHLAGILADFA